jgi:hypothetical protein
MHSTARYQNIAAVTSSVAMNGEFCGLSHCAPKPAKQAALIVIYCGLGLVGSLNQKKKKSNESRLSLGQKQIGNSDNNIRLRTSYFGWRTHDYVCRAGVCICRDKQITVGFMRRANKLLQDQLERPNNLLLVD